MSLKSILFGIAKKADSINAKYGQRKSLGEKQKYEAIKSSDQYYDLLDEGDKFENELVLFNSNSDLEEEYYNYKMVAENWLKISMRMKQLTAPSDLPKSVVNLFIDSHKMLIKAAEVRSDICILHLAKIKAELEEDYKRERENERRIKELSDLHSEIHKSFQNGFDILLDCLN